jgi:hypothetical protein
VNREEPDPNIWPLPIDLNTPMDPQEMLTDEDWEELLAKENPPATLTVSYATTPLNPVDLWSDEEVTEQIERDNAEAARRIEEMRRED